VRERCEPTIPCASRTAKRSPDDQGIADVPVQIPISTGFAGALDLLGQRLMVQRRLPQARRILAEFGEALPDE
jgi:hypothetical protein